MFILKRNEETEEVSVSFLVDDLKGDLYLGTITCRQDKLKTQIHKGGGCYTIYKPCLNLLKLTDAENLESFVKNKKKLGILVGFDLSEEQICLIQNINPIDIARNLIEVLNATSWMSHLGFIIPLLPIPLSMKKVIIDCIPYWDLKCIEWSIPADNNPILYQTDDKVWYEQEKDISNKRSSILYDFLEMTKYIENPILAAHIYDKTKVNHSSITYFLVGGYNVLPPKVCKRYLSQFQITNYLIESIVKIHQQFDWSFNIKDLLSSIEDVSMYPLIFKSDILLPDLEWFILPVGTFTRNISIDKVLDGLFMFNKVDLPELVDIIFKLPVSRRCVVSLTKLVEKKHLDKYGYTNYPYQFIDHSKVRKALNRTFEGLSRTEVAEKVEYLILTYHKTEGFDRFILALDSRHLSHVIATPSLWNKIISIQPSAIKYIHPRLITPTIMKTLISKMTKTNLNLIEYCPSSLYSEKLVELWQQKMKELSPTYIRLYVLNNRLTYLTLDRK